jgi:hypothetical protein
MESKRSYWTRTVLTHGVPMQFAQRRQGADADEGEEGGKNKR